MSGSTSASHCSTRGHAYLQRVDVPRRQPDHASATFFAARLRCRGWLVGGGAASPFGAAASLRAPAAGGDSTDGPVRRTGGPRATSACPRLGRDDLVGGHRGRCGRSCGRSPGTAARCRLLGWCPWRRRLPGGRFLGGRFLGGLRCSATSMAAPSTPLPPSWRVAERPSSRRAAGRPSWPAAFAGDAAAFFAVVFLAAAFLAGGAAAPAASAATASPSCGSTTEAMFGTAQSMLRRAGAKLATTSVTASPTFITSRALRGGGSDISRSGT